MKKIFVLFAILLGVNAYAQRDILYTGNYKNSDTIVITTVYNHTQFDSIKFFVVSNDSVSLFIDRCDVDPYLGAQKLAYGSWTTVDSLSGFVNNGTGYGTGNLLVSSAWKPISIWNNMYRLRFKSVGNAAKNGTMRFGVYMKKR